MTTKRYQAAQRRYLRSENLRAKSRWIDVEVESGARRTHVLESGDGTPIVFLSGSGAPAAAWAPLMARLPGHRLLAPDAPGCGGSDPVDYRGVNLRRHAVRWIEGVLDELGVKSAVFVANSMGARWATWFALEHPRRVRGIVALGIPAFLLDTSVPLPIRLFGSEWIGRALSALAKPSRRRAHAFWRRLGHRREMASPELVELTLALMAQPGYMRSWRTLLSNALELLGPAPGMGLDESQLALLAIPIAFGVGNRDPFGDVEVAREAARIAPDATMEVVGTGHLPWLDDPLGCAKLVEGLLSRAEREKLTRAVA